MSGKRVERTYDYFDAIALLSWLCACTENLDLVPSFFNSAAGTPACLPSHLRFYAHPARSFGVMVLIYPDQSFAGRYLYIHSVMV